MWIELGGVEGFTPGGDVGSDASVFTFIGCKVSSTLRSGAIGMVVYGVKIFLF